MTQRRYNLSLACLIGVTLLGVACKNTRLGVKVFDNPSEECLRKSEAYIQQGEELLHQNKRQKALNCFWKAVPLAKKSTFGLHATLRTHFTISSLYFRKDMILNSDQFLVHACHSALSYTNSSIAYAAQEYLRLFRESEIEYAKLFGDILRPIARVKTGSAFNILGVLFALGKYKQKHQAYEEGIKIFENALKIVLGIQRLAAPKARPELMVVSTLVNGELGRIHTSLSNYKQAVHHYSQAIEDYEQLRPHSENVKLETVDGRPLIAQLEEYLQKTQAALEQKQAGGTSQAVGKIMKKYYALGEKQLAAGQCVEAAASFRRSIHAFTDSKLAYHPLISACYVMLGTTLLFQDKDQAAEKHFKQAVALAKQEWTTYYLTLEACMTISEVYLEKKREDKAKAYTKIAFPYATNYDTVSITHTAKEYLTRFPKNLVEEGALGKNILQPFSSNHLGSTHFNVLGTHYYLGSLSITEQAFDRAKKIFENGLKVVEAAQEIVADKGTKRTDLQCLRAIINYQLGLASHKLGAYQQAIEYYTQALAAYACLQTNERLIALDIFESGHVKTKLEAAQKAWVNKYKMEAEACTQKDDYQGAIALCGKALAVCDAHGSIDRSDDIQKLLFACLDVSTRRFELKVVALECRTEGDKCMGKRQYVAAEEHYSSALSIYNRNFASEHATVERMRCAMKTAAELAIKDLRDLGEAAERDQDLKEALFFYKKALALQNKHFPEATSKIYQLTSAIARISKAMS